jgi:hypothetical protein
MRNFLLFFQKNTYRKEILLIIIVKLIALWALWLICFSHPIDKTHIQEAVTEQLLGAHSPSS